MVGCHEVQRGPAEHLVERVADQGAQRRVGVGDEAVLVEHDALCAGLHELGQALLGLAHGALGEAVLGDVGDEHEGTDGLALLAHVRQQVDLDEAHAAIGLRQLPLVGGRLLVAEHELDTRLDLLGRLPADHLGKGPADDGAFVGAEGACIGLVGELALEVTGAVVGDQHRHVVGQQAEQRGLRPGLALGALAGTGVVQQAQPLVRVGLPARRPFDPGRTAAGAGDEQVDREVGLRGQPVEQLAAAVGVEQFLPRPAEQSRRLAAGEGREGAVHVQRAAFGVELQQHARQRVPGRRLRSPLTVVRHGAGVDFIVCMARQRSSQALALSCGLRSR